MLEDLLDRAACVRAAKEFEKSRRIFIVDLFYSTVRFALHSDLAVAGEKCFYDPPWRLHGDYAPGRY